MGNQGSNLTVSDVSTVTITPTFITLKNGGSYSNYKGKINQQDILNYFKTNKLKKKYFLGIPGYTYKIVDTKMKGKKVVYKIRYTKRKGKKSNENDDASVEYLSEYIKDGLHKETHAGDPKLFKKIGKDKIYILVKYQNVDVKL